MEFLFEMSLPKLKGHTRAEFEAIARESFEKYLRKNVYPGALREIDALRKRGVRVILATSTPFEAVYPLALFCGISAGDIVATQFSYTDGKFDGKLIGVPVFSQFKCSIIRTFAERNGTDLAHCSFYSDSIHDLPLLELVGHPVPSNADFRLRKVARERGWQTKDFSK
jgi:HAD superfamily hydrolase (TIGR01490 family)